MSKKAHYSSD